MKILLLVAACCIAAFLFFKKGRHANTITSIDYGPFTVKMELSENRKFNLNAGKMVTEQNLAYSIWYKGKAVVYPEALEKNTGYTHLWRVYILDGAPKPTLIAGSQALYMVFEQDGKAMVTSLDAQRDDFASFQYLDSDHGQPGTVKELYMATGPDSVQTLKGGTDLFVSQAMILHVSDLKVQPTMRLNQLVDGYNFLKTGGAQSYAPDKKSIAMMGSKINASVKYDYAMIVCNIADGTAYAVPYDRTDTRSVDLNYDDRKWFATYFEWIKKTDGSYALQTRKYDVLPAWQGLYKDEGEKVYQLTPVKKEMQNAMVDFILKELDLKKDALHAAEQYHENSVIIWYKDQRLDVWLRPDENILVLMLQDGYSTYAKDGIATIHRIGDAFNKELAAGHYNEYFTRF